ncbi:nitrogenase-stabilizing/protective protein NifW [Roseospira visakhapatnamensis]|uniref:Nitrogenase-stabilizing/protective protein NifW n=1 Tax=Roseospira visakhapatnamensis TaxID=390880 RepID=A0A7W6RCR1_9PROT|nr:nitrogenase-stabilizing/protective protein NifW [Roseospira visakhapatnamensis]MBB4265947.1 nitrogenase-stabilizing/protective protein [Roseospira visakhapatnamensis]
MNAAVHRLKSLSAAEEFFEALDVAYDPRVLAVSRLHVLKRFREYLIAYEDPDETILRDCLRRAHEDFVQSDARRERVFAVFRQRTDVAGRAFIPLEALAPMPSPTLESE